SKLLTDNEKVRIASAHAASIVNGIKPVTVPTVNTPNVVTGSVVSSAAIYFPYAENFASASELQPSSLKLLAKRKATIVYADRDADSGPGSEPYSCSGGTCYRT